MLVKDTLATGELTVCVEPICVHPDPEGAEETHAVPFEVRTFPDVPGATVCGAPVPLPRRTAFDVSVPVPMPPCCTR